MSDYISREAALEAFENADADVMEDYGDGTSDWGFGRENIRETLNRIPAADVEPVRHGDRVVFQNDRFLVRLAREADLLPMEYGNRTYLRDGHWLVQESADYFVAVLCYRGADEEAGKIGLLEQMDWRD